MGILVDVFLRLAEPLPDGDDEAFLETAIARGADFLVTGDLRHFPARLRQEIVVLSPREFLEALFSR